MWLVFLHVARGGLTDQIGTQETANFRFLPPLCFVRSILLSFFSFFEAAFPGADHQPILPFFFQKTSGHLVEGGEVGGAFCNRSLLRCFGSGLCRDRNRWNKRAKKSWKGLGKKSWFCWVLYDRHGCYTASATLLHCTAKLSEALPRGSKILGNHPLPNPTRNTTPTTVQHLSEDFGGKRDELRFVLRSKLGCHRWDVEPHQPRLWRKCMYGFRHEVVTFIRTLIHTRAKRSRPGGGGLFDDTHTTLRQPSWRR